MLSTGANPSDIARQVNHHGRRVDFHGNEIIALNAPVPGARPRGLIYSNGGGMIWLGVYNPATTYTVGQVVVIQTGPAQGTYICVTPNNTNQPDTGQGWVSLGGDFSAGIWL